MLDSFLGAGLAHAGPAFEHFVIRLLRARMTWWWRAPSLLALIVQLLQNSNKPSNKQQVIATSFLVFVLSMRLQGCVFKQ